MHSATYPRRRRVSLTYVNRLTDSYNVEGVDLCCAQARVFVRRPGGCVENGLRRRAERGAAPPPPPLRVGSFVVSTSD
jgi:hypothetical protein